MVDTEIERIREVYAKRPGPGRYDPLRPDVVDALAACHRAWGRALYAEQRRPGATLEIGCGAAAPLSWLQEGGARPAVGVDVQVERLAQAAATRPSVALAAADGRRLPFRTGAFSTAVCAVLFSSVLDDDVATALAAEIRRVVAPGGVVLWFDLALPNPRNADVRPFGRKALRRLFPGARQDLQRCVLVPTLARRLGAHQLASSVLACLPPLRSHLAGALWLP